MKAIYNWFGRHASGPYGTFIFCLLTFIEGFFIVPVSTLLAFYCLEKREKAIYYGILATIFSGFGALAGYLIGMLIWKTAGVKFIYYLISPEKFDYLVSQYKAYQAWAVFIVALTPMPFKALTLTAGFCGLPLLSFLAFTLMARGTRFMLISTSIYIWGDKVNYFLNKYFYYIMAIGISFFILSIWLVH